jgi:hypothetical protein
VTHVSLATTTLFSVLTAVIVLLVYRIMGKLIEIERQLVEIRTDVAWLKKYLTDPVAGKSDQYATGGAGN